MHKPFAFLAAAALLAAAPAADACKPPRDYRRDPAHNAYDAHYRQWAGDAAAALVKDADPNIAWASLVLLLQAGETDRVRDLDLPPDPTTGAGRLMRYAYCRDTERCSPAISQWVEAEPDNLLVLALGLREDANYASKVRRKLDAATRWDDYADATRTLEATLLGRVPAPPPAPAGYVLPACSAMTFDAAAPRPNLGNVPAATGAASVFLEDGRIANPVRSKIAQVLTAPGRPPLTAAAGARVGTWASSDKADLARYCALDARAQSFEQKVYEWTATGGHGVDAAVRNEYVAALATRNGIDALAEIAAKLPAQFAPKPVDDAAVTKCNARLAKD